MKKIMKVILIVLIVIAALLLFLIVKNFIDSRKSYYEDDYYKSFISGGPLEQKYAGAGPLEVSNVVIKAENKTIGKYRIFYPTKMEQEDGAYPLIVVTNASNTAAINYKPFFERLASWGFIVIGNDDRQTGTGKTTSETLDYILACREDESSIFYGKIDEEKIGCVGYSQGGAGAINAVTGFDNSVKFKSLFTGSAAYPLLAKNMGWEYDAGKINIPYFMTAGTGSSDDNGKSIHDASALAGIAPLASLVENYDAISGDVLKVRARIIGAEHGDMQTKSDGYMTAWMLYTLCGDVEAGKVFVGENAELTANNKWQDVAISCGRE